MKLNKILVLGILAASFSCTDLNEELRDTLSKEEAQKFLNENTDVNSLLRGAYDGLRLPFMDQAQFWAAQQHTSDETLGPTRGGDWDDNGVWRVLHTHSWGTDHSFLEATFNSLLEVVFTTTNILTFPVTPRQAAEARYIRAFVMFSVADAWNQVPFREPGGNLLEAPTVLTGDQAIDFVISELNAIINDLPEGPVNRANKDAARTLLMKCYLNKGTFSNRATPTFPAADMGQVVTLADQLINSGKYSLANNYFDNFAPNNDQISTENIWTGENQGGSSSGNVRSRWFCTLHYNQNPSGWNGFTTLGDFYDSFEANDNRLTADYPGMTNVGGIKAGLLFGQQFDENGTALLDRKGNPLSFTKEVAPVETGNNLEVTGIRVVKYPIDYNNGDNSDNDYVFFRYADVLLMKAEALLRTGNAGGALTIVNEIRTKRGASTLGSLSLDQLLAERGRELYWEGHRRQDLIRFGKWLQPWQGKPASGPERLVFAIPPTNLAVNPNLKQNPGY
ncbi:MAG: RagB/SusD family nutrient uptake outer membrane protein [Saprospiraceae bacterium]|nr:RagB/SusD family nutrient uptake outer membrane protein [Saprospiraceae bacterium]